MQAGESTFEVRLHDLWARGSQLARVAVVAGARGIAKATGRLSFLLEQRFAQTRPPGDSPEVRADLQEIDRVLAARWSAGEGRGAGELTALLTRQRLELLRYRETLAGDALGVSTTSESGQMRSRSRLYRAGRRLSDGFDRLAEGVERGLRRAWSAVRRTAAV